MKNNEYSKKFLIKTICVSSCIIVLLTYTKNFNITVEAMINKITEKYPDVTENDLIQIINSKDINKINVLAKYGIDTNNNSAVLANEKRHVQFLFITILLLF